MINLIYNFLSSYPFLFIAESTSFTMKMFILAKLFIHRTNNKIEYQRPWTLLILVLTGSALASLSWIVKILQITVMPNIDYRLVILLIRIAWMFEVVMYQSLGLFIETLVSKSKRISWHQKIFLTASIIYCAIIGWITLFNTISFSRPKIEFMALTHISIFIPIIVFTSLISAFFQIKKNQIPKILQKQLNIFLFGLIAPLTISDIIQLYPFNLIPEYVTSNYAFVGLSSMLIAYAMHFCVNRVMRLRFLNLKKHVTAKEAKYYFIDQFKYFLEQLSQATTMPELNLIVKTYFKETLDIPEGKANLHIINPNKGRHQIDNLPMPNQQSIQKTLANSLITKNPDLVAYLQKSQILIYDEIDFNSFYEKNTKHQQALSFLNQINAEIFIPIYQKQSLIAYVTVEKDIYSKKLYSNVERDEMIIFTRYLGNIINLMQKRNLDILVKQEKNLKEEIYQKHQQINQYKESIRSFIKQSQYKKIGIIFYKNRRFFFGNQQAKEVVAININNQPGHPLTKKLEYIAKQVESYKSPQSSLAKDTQGNQIILTAIPNLEQSNVIITIHYPDITDVIKRQIDSLNDPSQWDYLLYLETTKSGQLVNQMIPGTGETLLNLKVSLLKAALSKKAVLISMPEADLMPAVELIHHVSLRNTFLNLKLHSPATNFDTAIKLFGINPIFGQSEEQPLLQKLNGNGTLFIENIHYLDLETQNYLAEFIRYGFYHIFKSEQKMASDVRIICSTSQNLQTLVYENKFSQALYNELQQTTIIMPSLLTLPEQEVTDLVHSLTEQTLEEDTFKNLLELNAKEHKKLISKRPTSIIEFKTKIQQLLTEKSKQNHIYQDTQFDPAHDISDPKLIEASRLGKQALKDPSVMGLLWNKFQNQNKIASFLGVNRSSVHRRCKEYNLY